LYATMLRVAFESARAKDLGLPPPAMTPQVRPFDGGCRASHFPLP
jgi:hypothetical protein